MVTYIRTNFLRTATPMPHVSGRSPRGGDRHGPNHVIGCPVCGVIRVDFRHPKRAAAIARSRPAEKNVCQLYFRVELGSIHFCTAVLQAISGTAIAKAILRPCLLAASLRPSLAPFLSLPHSLPAPLPPSLPPSLPVCLLPPPYFLVPPSLPTAVVPGTSLADEYKLKNKTTPFSKFVNYFGVNTSFKFRSSLRFTSRRFFSAVGVHLSAVPLSAGGLVTSAAKISRQNFIRTQVE